MPSLTDSVLNSGAQWVMGAKIVPVRVGVPNPYGAGASAYEPQTLIYDPSNDPLMAGSTMQTMGYSKVDKDAADAAAAATAKAQADAETAAANQLAASVTSRAASRAKSGSPIYDGVTQDGSALSLINAAKQLLGKPYVWGGTTINGTDCSGLLYYAFNQAGIKMPRYRAVDYGRMGKGVTSDAARPGDIVYYDEPGSTDHVGIYLGNGMMIDSPTSGTVTRIEKVWGGAQYRRIINDANFGQMSTPSGGTTPSYNGKATAEVFGTGVSVGASIGRMRPI